MIVPRMRVEVTEEQCRAISRAFRNKHISSGDDIGKLEAELKSLFGKTYCFLTVNGFSAIFLALAAMGLKGYKVLLPAVSTCFSIFHAVKASGNIPVLADVNENDFNMACSSAENIVLSEDVAAIISPNHAGILSDVRGLKKMNVPVIEDCAQSFLSNAGLETVADFQTFSFYPTKMINGIDGGALLTSDPHMGERIADIGSYAHQTRVDDAIRYNMKMPNLHAALCLIDVARWKDKRERIDEVVSAYDAVLGKFEGVRRVGSDSIAKSCLYKYIIVFDSPDIKSSVEGRLHSRGIECAREYIALWARGKNTYPNASKLLASTFSIPLYEAISDEEVSYVCECLEQALGEAFCART